MVTDDERLKIEKIRFVARGEAVGCGRPPPIGPLTRAQALYEEQYREWEEWRKRDGSAE